MTMTLPGLSQKAFAQMLQGCSDLRPTANWNALVALLAFNPNWNALVALLAFNRKISTYE